MEKKRTTVWLNEENVTMFSHMYPLMLSRFINNCLRCAINDYSFCLKMLFEGDEKK